ncbi:tRNA lysidine(34) synthetase TilS [Microbacterium sp. YY-01]|uniref:tRNA lysidine(34) synthetase TilS n=1 Tax=Microbacterium sp. YY-01 TaxID=3421634 RepID=UPI003D17B2BB
MPEGRLHPAVAEVRVAVRRQLAQLPTPITAVTVALSGGADSLAVLAATVFEARRLDCAVHAVTVDHQLQAGSAEIAQRAAEQATHLGAQASVVAVTVDEQKEGPEAAARTARYDALRAAAHSNGSDAVVLGHTLDDQAETVLLGLARGSGSGSLQGMAAARCDDEGLWWLRPMLGVRRATTQAVCVASGIDYWNDPHNSDDRYTRVRVRRTVLPMLEDELGPGIAEALARTAEQLREDSDAFDAMIRETIEDIVEPAEAGIAVSVAALAANPAALRNRIIRFVVASEFGAMLTRQQTLEVARLVTDWRGQGPIDLPACQALRSGGRIMFRAHH